MNTNHLDAQAIAQPGGLYPSINKALLDGLLAYFQHRDRQAQEERQLRRDERTMGREQLRDALANAERYGVAPGSTESGWIPAGQESLVEAAIKSHADRQALEQKQRQVQDVAQRVAMLKAAREQGPGAFPTGQFTPEMAAAWSEGQKDRAREQAIEALRQEALKTQVASAKNEAVWNNPLMRTLRGVGNFASDAVQEAIKASGRQKAEKPQGWRVNEDMSQSRQLEDGSTIFVKPDGSSYILNPMGQNMSVADYQKSIGAAPGAPGPVAGGANGTVDVGSPAPQGRDMTTADMAAAAARVGGRGSSVRSENDEALTAQEVRGFGRQGIDVAMAVAKNTLATLPPEKRAGLAGIIARADNGDRQAIAALKEWHNSFSLDQERAKSGVKRTAGAADNTTFNPSNVQFPTR